MTITKPTGRHRNAVFFWHSNFGGNTSAFMTLKGLERASLVNTDQARVPAVCSQGGPSAGLPSQVVSARKGYTYIPKSLSSAPPRAVQPARPYRVR
jgi:hypothetical protein